MEICHDILTPTDAHVWLLYGLRTVRWKVIELFLVLRIIDIAILLNYVINL
jgi:hypothetical protein